MFQGFVGTVAQTESFGLERMNNNYNDVSGNDDNSSLEVGDKDLVL